MMLAGAGDTLLTTPMLRELRAACPDARIDALVMQGPSACEVLYSNPAIDNLIYHNFMKTPKLDSLKFCLDLRKKRYDCLIVPMPHNRLAYNVVAALIGAGNRIGYEYNIKCGAFSRLFLQKTIRENTSLHLVENNLRVVTEGLGCELSSARHRLDLFVSKANDQFADAFVDEYELSGKCVIGMHPGSGVTKNLHLKRWAPDKWAGLARAVSEKYESKILLFGGKEEDSLKEEIIELSGLPEDIIVNIKDGSVLETAALMKKCSCIVSGDTLIPHVAAAMGVRSAVVYGPTSHVAAAPYESRHELIRTGIYCSPCYGFSRHGIECKNKVFLKCLKDLTVDMAMEAVDKLLDDTLAK